MTRLTLIFVLSGLLLAVVAEAAPPVRRADLKGMWEEDPGTCEVTITSIIASTAALTDMTIPDDGRCRAKNSRQSSQGK